jgi:2-polyprenyl-3-methyl-5-hydroxy-6-metoxy-1,4-benzoquinol methylase
LRLLTGDGWEIWHCPVCTNAWTEPPPGNIPYDAKDFHSETQVNDAEAESSLEQLPAPWRRAVRQQVALLQRHLPAGARVLEVGCGAGILLQAMRDAGFEVVGLEPSHAASARARQRGLKVYQGYFPSAELSAKEKPFAAVVMTHVLEHIGMPMDVLRATVAAAPGGRLLLVQTNWRGLVPRSRGRKWYAWVPDEHFWHFTPQGLERLTAPLGFARVACEYSSLVPAGRTARWLSRLAQLAPRLRDQFHLLLKLPERL